MDNTELLFQDITTAAGVPGYEADVRTVIRRYLEPMTTIVQDKMGDIICRKEGAAASPRVMLAAHMDEIGFMVKLITKDGFLRFVPLGGWMDQVLLGQRVIVKTSKGDIVGVIGARPPHLVPQDERSKLVAKKDMYIDIGASSEDEVRAAGVRVGDPVIPASDFAILANPKTYLSKAWDDRVGCALFIRTIQELAGMSHPNTVYAVGTTQEEVGLRGAKTSAHVVNPDVAIVLEADICGDLPGIKPEESNVKLGGGPSQNIFDVRMIPNLRLRDLAISTAQEIGVPMQFATMEGGATDGGVIHMHNEGVPTITLGVPVRHIHCHNSIIHRDDFEGALKLVVALVQKLDAETVTSLTS
jgi:putative aminopeptidase FrvX